MDPTCVQHDELNYIPSERWSNFLNRESFAPQKEYDARIESRNRIHRYTYHHQPTLLRTMYVVLIMRHIFLRGANQFEQTASLAIKIYAIGLSGFTIYEGE